MADNKLTVIIAEDELIERKALRLLLIKEFPQVQIVAEAENGIQLVEYVKKYKPDLAIVDVNMPGISGLDAIELLNNGGIRTRYIINTAYDQFDYVQKAISYHVEAYLLKPDSRDHTISTIAKVCEELLREKLQKDSDRQIQELFTNITPILENEIMYSLVLNETIENSMEIWCDMHQISFTGGIVVVLAPVLSNQRILEKHTKAQVRKIVHQAVHHMGKYIVSINESSINLLFFHEQMAHTSWLQWILELLDLALDRMNAEVGIAFYAGVGSMGQSFSELHTSYREAIQAMYKREKSGISTYQPEQPDSTEQFLKNVVSGIIKPLRTGDKQLMYDQLGAIKSSVCTNLICIKKLWKCLSLEMISDVSQWPEFESMFRSIGQKIEEERDNECAYQLLCRGLNDIFTTLHRDDSQSGCYVNYAIKYMRNHYAEDLSLDTMAEIIGVSSSYFSRIFRNETGKKYIEYLTDIRMEQAVHLAKETRLTISEIARQTGYNNITYFCRVFKKSTGFTIGEMRLEEKNLKNENGGKKHG